MSRVARSLACAVVMIIPAARARGQDDLEGDGRWRLEVTPYLWLAGNDGDVATAVGSVEVDQNLDDVIDALDDLKLGGALHVEVHNNRWGLFGEAWYIDLESDARTPAGAKAEVGFEQFIGELGAFCRLLQTGGRQRRPQLDLLGGVRVNWLELAIDIEGIGSGDRERTWVDPFVGLRGELEAIPRMVVYGRGDIGGFGIDAEHTSDFTWLAEVGAYWRISDHFSWSLGYRWFDTDYESGSFAYDVNLNGPITALTIRF